LNQASPRKCIIQTNTKLNKRKKTQIAKRIKEKALIGEPRTENPKQPIVTKKKKYRIRKTLFLEKGTKTNLDHVIVGPVGQLSGKKRNENTTRKRERKRDDPICHRGKR